MTERKTERRTEQRTEQRTERVTSGRRCDVVSRDPYVATVREVLSEAECRAWIAEMEGLGFEAAPITTGAGFVMAPSVRNNTRVMVDDAARAAVLWERVAPHAPEEVGRWRAVGLNERFRVYRYEPGQYFRWHADGAFRRSAREASLLTCMVYLNDAGLLGGETEFADFDPVRPETGKVLLFDHHLMHQGAPVFEGVKYVLRTDVMYRQR